MLLGVAVFDALVEWFALAEVCRLDLADIHAGAGKRKRRGQGQGANSEAAKPDCVVSAMQQMRFSRNVIPFGLEVDDRWNMSFNSSLQRSPYRNIRTRLLSKKPGQDENRRAFLPFALTFPVPTV